MVTCNRVIEGHKSHCQLATTLWNENINSMSVQLEKLQPRKEFGLVDARVQAAQKNLQRVVPLHAGKMGEGVESLEPRVAQVAHT